MSTPEGPTTCSVNARWDSGLRAVVQARQFELVVDEPEAVGGTDSGPTPTEYLLASLASCYALALAYSAAKRAVALPPFNVQAEGTYDGPSFSHIGLVVRMADPPSELATLLERARRVCYVSNTLARDPGIEVTLA